MNEWKSAIEEAEKFHKIAKSDSEKFNETLKMDVAGMAMEKYLLGLLFFNNVIPDGDLLYNYIQDLKKIFTVPRDLIDEIMTVSKSENLCTLEPGVPVYGSGAKLSKYRTALLSIRGFIEENSPDMKITREIA